MTVLITNVLIPSALELLITSCSKSAVLNIAVRLADYRHAMRTMQIQWLDLSNQN